MLGLASGSWAAYQLDVATLQVGRWIEGRLEERDKKGQRIYRLETLLDDEVVEQRFRKVEGLVVRKVAIPESGVW